MEASLTEIGTLLYFTMMMVLPAYFIFVKARFLYAFLSIWLMMLAGLTFGLLDAWNLYDYGDGRNTNTLAAVFFSGWFLALPYCLILKLAHNVFSRIQRNRNN